MDNISIIVRIPASTYFFQTNENSQSEILLVSNLLRKILIRHETFLTEQFDVSYSQYYSLQCHNIFLAVSTKAFSDAKERFIETWAPKFVSS